MINKFFDFYVYLFARERFAKLNKLLFRMSLRGLGVLNYKNSLVSGEKNFIKTCLAGKDGGIVVDVGANEGAYSREVIDANPSLCIYAFEPHKKTFPVLLENVSGHEGVVCFNNGMSDQRGVLKLYDYFDKDGSSHASLYEDVITEMHGSEKAISHEVELVTLDEFVEEQEIRGIDLLKIDTEGNELSVLKGAVNSLSSGKIKVIHFEFNEMNVASRVFFKDFWQLLNDYTLYRLLPNGMLKIDRYSPLSCEIFAYQNVVAVLNERSV